MPGNVRRLGRWKGKQRASTAVTRARRGRPTKPLGLRHLFFSRLITRWRDLARLAAAGRIHSHGARPGTAAARLAGSG